MKREQKVPKKNPIEEVLLRHRDDFVMKLYTLGFDGNDIAVAINRSRQLVSHIIKKRLASKPRQ